MMSRAFRRLARGGALLPASHCATSAARTPRRSLSLLGPPRMRAASRRILVSIGSAMHAADRIVPASSQASATPKRKALASDAPARLSFDAAVDADRQHALNDDDLSMARERRTIPLMRDLSAAAQECPLAPPEHASVQSRALHRACLILGGVTALAKRLEVSEADVERWLRGEVEMPERVFLHAVEIVLLHAATVGRRN